MSLLHPASAGAAPECLELFKLVETQTGVLRTYVLELRPISTHEGSSAEFHMRPDSPDYGNLKEMKLYGKLRIVNADGSAITAEDKVIAVNLYMHSIWKQIDVKLGNMIMSHPQQMYGYKAMIKTLLKLGSESKLTQAAAEGFLKDLAGKMDATDPANSKTFLDRGKLFQLSNWVDFEGHLLEDCLELNRLLLNNVPVTVKLTGASNEFVLMADDATKKFKYQISDLKLKLTMVSVSPGVILGHAEALKTSNALYPFKRVETSNFSIAKGSRNVHLTDITVKSVPNRLVVGMVEADAFNGNYKKNPYNFQHFHVTNMSLVVNEMVVGGQPLEVNFDKTSAKGRDYVSAYNNMFNITGTEGENFGNNILLEDFAEGYALFCFNLDPFSKPGKYLNLVKTGFVRLAIQFSKPLEETIVVVLYSEHQDMFQIDAAKNVILT